MYLRILNLDFETHWRFSEASAGLSTCRKAHGKDIYSVLYMVISLKKSNSLYVMFVR
jgi:hypothetical protein